MDSPPPVTVAPEERKTKALSRYMSDMDLTKWFSFLGISGVAYSFLFHPSYLVVARQQTHRDNSLPASFFIREVYRDTGVRGFFRGLVSMTIGTVISEYAYMGVLESMREHTPLPTQFQRDFAAGAVADIVSAVLYIPFGLISNRQMTAGYGVCDYAYENSWKAAQVIYRQKGGFGFFQGLVPQLLLMPASGLWWGIYGWAKEIMYANHEGLMRLYGERSKSLPVVMTSPDDNVVINGVSGALAGTTLALLANPLWVVKARVQVMDIPMRGALRFVVKDMIQKEGYYAFYKGVSMNAIVYALESAVYCGFYEYWKALASVHQ